MRSFILLINALITLAPRPLTEPMMYLMKRLLLLALVTIAACQSSHLTVESDTQWSGTIGVGTAAHSVDGSGRQEFDLDMGTVCWTFQKQTARGSLRVYMTTGGLFPSRDGDAVTEAAYGIVSGCGG